jgi:hypothetical protein
VILIRRESRKRRKKHPPLDEPVEATIQCSTAETTAWLSCFQNMIFHRMLVDDRMPNVT